MVGRHLSSNKLGHLKLTLPSKTTSFPTLPWPPAFITSIDSCPPQKNLLAFCRYHSEASREGPSLFSLPFDMSTQGAQQAPIVVQRQHSVRTTGTTTPRSPQHVRTNSSARGQGRGAEAGPSSASSRDPETVRLVPGTGPSPHRPSHSRQPSVMSEASTNGTSAQASSMDDRLNEHPRTAPRQRKTTIHGATGTWVLGKTIGAGSMGKVKLAKKQDGSEQVR